VASEFAAVGTDVATNWLDDDSAGSGLPMRSAPADGGRKCGDGVGHPRRARPDRHFDHNAGVFPRVPFLEMTERDWDHVLDVNLKGSCFCAQYVAKAIVSGGRQGAIINIASGAALRGSPTGVHYVAS